MGGWRVLIYRHRQVGTLVLFLIGFCVVVAAVVLVRTLDAPVATRFMTGLVLVILLCCIDLFHSLSVEVTTQELTVFFGRGWIKKRFRIADIRAARSVRNSWYYGWGIRLTPHGWLYNVSGLDAVELELGEGRKFRIGTDEPQQLTAAIQTACGESRRTE
jgi:hypothetical protein